MSALLSSAIATFHEIQYNFFFSVLTAPSLPSSAVPSRSWERSCLSDLRLFRLYVTFSARIGHASPGLRSNQSYRSRVGNSKTLICWVLVPCTNVIRFLPLPFLDVAAWEINTRLPKIASRGAKGFLSITVHQVHR